MALNMDVESDEEVLDQEPEEPDESDGEEAAMGEHLASTRAGDAEEEEEVGAARCGDAQGDVKVAEIDAYWLQRQINEYEKNPEKSALVAEQVLAILQSEDEVGVRRGREA